MRRRIPLSHLLLIVPLLLSACSSVQPEQEGARRRLTFSAWENPYRSSLLRVLASINVLNAGLTSQALDDINMKTIETVDFKGVNPLSTSTFTGA